MEQRGEQPRFPPAPYQYLVQWWLEIGPALTGAMGAGPLPMRYIADEMETLGVEVTPFEAKAIRAMSRAFLEECREARKAARRAPYSDDLPEEVQDKVSAQFKAMVQAFQRRSSP